MNVTSNCDLTNSAHQRQMTTPCHLNETPHENFFAYATASVNDLLGKRRTVPAGLLFQESFHCGKNQFFHKTEVPRGIAAICNFNQTPDACFQGERFLLAFVCFARLLFCIWTLQYFIGFQNESFDASDITKVRSKGYTNHFCLRVIRYSLSAYEHFLPACSSIFLVCVQTFFASQALEPGKTKRNNKR